MVAVRGWRRNAVVAAVSCLMCMVVRVDRVVVGKPEVKECRSQAVCFAGQCLLGCRPVSIPRSLASAFLVPLPVLSG